MRKKRRNCHQKPIHDFDVLTERIRTTIQKDVISDVKRINTIVQGPVSNPAAHRHVYMYVPGRGRLCPVDASSRVDDRRSKKAAP